MHFILDLGNSRFFSLWDPEIDGFTRYTERTGSWRRESMDILTFTIDHVWNLLNHIRGGVFVYLKINLSKITVGSHLYLHHAMRGAGINRWLSDSRIVSHPGTADGV